MTNSWSLGNSSVLIFFFKFWKIRTNVWLGGGEPISTLQIPDTKRDPHRGSERGMALHNEQGAGQQAPNRGHYSSPGECMRLHLESPPDPVSFNPGPDPACALQILGNQLRWKMTARIIITIRPKYTWISYSSSKSFSLYMFNRK